MGKITRNSRVKQFYRHPVGRDIIRKILMQMNLNTVLVDNTLVGNLTLSSLARLTEKQLGGDFFDTLLGLLNQEQDVPAAGSGRIKKICKC